MTEAEFLCIISIEGGDGMVNAEEIGKRIAQLRKEKGLTQKELASQLNVTDKAVSKWERGINFPELTIMEPLAKELDTTVVYLLELENSSKEEIMDSVAEISISEKRRMLAELNAHSCLKIVFKIIIFIAMIYVSKVLALHEIYGWAQIASMGMIGFVGTLIGMEIYTIYRSKKLFEVYYKNDEKKKVTQNIKLCILPVFTLILEALPYGAVLNFAGDGETILKTFSYFSLTPFGFANFGPLLTAVLTCIVLLLLIICFVSKKDDLLHKAKIVTYIAVVTSLMPLLYGINYFSIIGLLISLSLLLEGFLFRQTI